MLACGVPGGCGGDGSSDSVTFFCSVKIFGDVHGQLENLLQFFSIYGSPEPKRGDIQYINCTSGGGAGGGEARRTFWLDMLSVDWEGKVRMKHAFSLYRKRC